MHASHSLDARLESLRGVSVPGACGVLCVRSLGAFFVCRRRQIMMDAPWDVQVSSRRTDRAIEKTNVFGIAIS